MSEIQNTTNAATIPPTVQVNPEPIVPPRKKAKYALVAVGANYVDYKPIVTDAIVPESNFVSGAFTSGDRVCDGKGWNNCTDSTYSISVGTAASSFGEKNVVSLYGEKTLWLAEIFGFTGGGVFDAEQAIEGEKKRWAWRGAVRLGLGAKLPLYKGSENNFDLALTGGMNLLGLDGTDGMIDFFSAFDAGLRVIWYWPQLEN
ncbi:MAG: hypothetical protein HYT75_03825 [Deltaproteobacteria bacterium]|nr:hypothetical protein [Deltaproteobacteria bacterium]MBI2341115.1 hypothetical protein [Deltaproteobacteria bacterium]